MRKLVWLLMVLLMTVVLAIGASQAQAEDQTVGGMVGKLGTATVYNVGGAVVDPFCMVAKGFDQWAGKSAGVERVARGACGAVWGAASAPVFQGVPRFARFIGDVVTCWQTKKQHSLKPCEAAPEYNAWMGATMPPY